jgi:hypothetical protein
MLRGDFMHWIPVGGYTEYVVSLVCKVLVKIISDFTSLVQFRHPNEVGGLYWMFGFVLTVLSLPGALAAAGQLEKAQRGVDLGTSIAMLFIPTSIVSLAVFFFSIDNKYWNTFFSLEKGKDLSVKNFRASKDDAVKAVFSLLRSKHHWKTIEEEVRAWVEENWERWEEEKPKWLDEGMKARVPVEWIPTAEGKRRESMRRASVDAQAEGGLGGALRASLRRASVGNAVGGDDVARVVPVAENEDREGE